MREEVWEISVSTIIPGKKKGGEKTEATPEGKRGE